MPIVKGNPSKNKAGSAVLIVYLNQTSNCFKSFEILPLYQRTFDFLAVYLKIFKTEQKLKRRKKLLLDQSVIFFPSVRSKNIVVFFPSRTAQRYAFGSKGIFSIAKPCLSILTNYCLNYSLRFCGPILYYGL